MVFTCPNTSDCVSLRRVNDGYADCLYAEDEKNSAYAMIEPFRYRCQTGSSPVQYVSFQQLGNGVNECADGSDEISSELSWSSLDCRIDDNYACWVFRGDGIIENRIKDVRLPFHLYCDTVWDTMDGRDERDCSKWVCARGTYQCNRTSQCIKRTYLCDGEFDCDDGEDELNCPRRSQEGSLEFVCNKSNEHFCITSQYLQDRILNRPCISYTNTGDGKIDCLGGQDERNVFSCSDHTMLGNRFLCDNQTKCLNYTTLCNGVFDCLDRTDEYICFCQYEQCIKEQLACSDTNSCENGRFRFEAYHSTNILTAWEYPISPFSFLPVFRLAKILRFPDRSLPWSCSYNHCQNNGTCYNSNNGQNLCLCQRGWRGAAGLYCGILLAEAGHTVTIFEASNRTGGRILTYRDPKNRLKYMAEMGAMRFPLDAHPYLNNLIRNRYKLSITETSSYDEHAYIYINGILVTRKQANENPDIFQFNTSQNERGKSPDQLLSEAVKPILQTWLEEGWLSIRNQWDSYSIESYLIQMNLSRAAIDYIAVSTNRESTMDTGLLQFMRSKVSIIDGTKFYRIREGNDKLIQSMVNECQMMESKQCSIIYSTPINKVQLLASDKISVMSKDGVDRIFDEVVVATSAPVTQFIDFQPRTHFIQKYLTLRQTNYICSSKILLTFNTSWWYIDENISEGASRTDLPIRTIFYPSTNMNQTDGGIIITAYTFAQDSIIWQSLSDVDAIEQALKQIMQIHRNSSSSIRNSFQGGVVKHWCQDTYVGGGFLYLNPFQETKTLDKLQASISNIHFIGEHTSFFNGWIEGALSSAVRAALSISTGIEITYDVVIIGGDPVGLMTAIFLSLKQPTLRIAIIEKETILNNSNSNSGSFKQQQFSQMHNEQYLVELANMSFTLWRQFEQMANMSFGSILNTDDGYLLVGDFNTNQSTIVDDFMLIKQICDNLRMGCEYLNNTQLKMRYPTFSFPLQYQGIFHHQSGFINMNTLTIALLRIISQKRNIIIRQQEEFLSLKLNNQTEITTNRGILYASRKVLIVPGPYTKNISHLFNFHLDITLWELPIYYFRLLPNATRFPTWLTWNSKDRQSIFFGFPSMLTSSGYIAVLPRFIRNLSKPLLYPSQRTNTADNFLAQKVLEWVSLHMATQVNVSDYYVNEQTYLTTFLPDNGFLLDYISQTNRRVLIQTAGCNMKFVPIWSDILSDMILFDEAMNTSSKYAKYMKYFSLTRLNRIIENTTTSNPSNLGFKTVSNYFLTFTLSFYISILTFNS
ncbi:unnamed protein product [Rotaria sordida]|uniref:EGF-like domain-containing protein n=1 Tax=Rotaria sordida TaxID=392033 RepID=A0A815CWT3_9BILA|nr:unnamed protein product [Rotaria sordida]CAF3846633.1 unnamed protein product [Rotaria sordida]